VLVRFSDPRAETSREARKHILPAANWVNTRANHPPSARIASLGRRPAKPPTPLTTATPATTQQTAVSTWAIDPAHSVAEFKVKHMMISNVKGQFSGVSGTLERHEGDVTKSKVEVTIDAASVNTRDAHLKSTDFFEVEKFPTLLFKSTRVIPENHDEHAVEGELTIHGVTHTVRFAVEGPTPPAKDPWG